MSATNFKTENNTLRKLMGNGLTYRIPRFQRDYSWSTEEWEDLWADISAMRESGGAASHYMGYLVLQSTDDKTFDVIDGQQRLTTISLIALAVLKNLQRLVDAGDDPEDNKTRLEQIRQTYIGYLDPVTLVSRSKLTLNRNNDSYFQDYLIPLGNLPKHGFRASEHLLRRAFEWFDKKIADTLQRQPDDQGAHPGMQGQPDGMKPQHTDDKGAYPDSAQSQPDGVKPQQPDDKGTYLAQLIESISDRLFFTVITVTDELNAYTVFETLNARGVRLSTTDLLKNYLFSLLNRGAETDHELGRLEERWEAIVGRLQAENFPNFLRAHWNSRHNFARHADLYKIIRAQVTDREAAFELLRDMEEDLDAYLALVSPEVSEWSQDDKRFAVTLKTFGVRQPLPLLLAARRVFSAEDFTGLMRATVVISLRYNVIGTLSPNEQKRTYNAVAKDISQGKLGGLNPALQAMRGIYIDDQRFRADFSEKAIHTRNSRIVRYILCALEKHLFGSDYNPVSDTFNIEHVLPQNAPDGWGGFSNEEAENLAHRLGNLTLLDARVNRDVGNEEYAAKRPHYERSEFALTQRLAEENAEWTPERLANWQGWMAKQATSVWRIEQLS